MTTTSQPRQLGFMACWDLQGVDVDHDTLVKLCQKHSIPNKYIPGERSPKDAFRKAKTLVTTSAKKKDLIFGGKPVLNSDQMVVWDVYRELPDGGTKRKARNFSQVRFDCASQAIAWSSLDLANPEDKDLLDWLEAETLGLYQQNLRHDSEDLRRLLSSWMRANAIPLKKTGGFYFVPATFGDELKNLSKLVGEFGNSSLNLVGAYACFGEDLAFYKAAATEALKAEAESLASDTEEFLNSATKGVKRGVKNRRQQLAELASKTEAMHRELSLEGDQLIADLNKVAERLGMPPVKINAPVPMAAKSEPVEEPDKDDSELSEYCKKLASPKFNFFRLK